jgi:flagellar hook-associated protein 1 FlgK
MTISSFMGLETALRGLRASQEAIDTTGHNIANANTPGYSRQRVDMTESPALTIPANSNVDGAGVQLGTGVDATSITRVRNAFLDVQYRAQNSHENEAQTQSTILDQIQTGLAEPSDNGLSKAMSNFWKAWSDFANDPTSQAAKQAVINSGQTLAQTFNTIDSQLATVQSQVGQQFSQLISSSGQVESDATQIASLNKSIASAQAAGQNPNDLLDQRDKLLDDLSSLADVTSSVDSTGMVTVTFGHAATPLVQGTTVNMPTATDLTPASGGQIGALLGLYDAAAGGTGTIQTSYRDVLDGVAKQVINDVNTAYQAGDPTVPDFFEWNPASTPAATIQVNPAVTASNVRAGSNAANAMATDVATAIANLRGQGPDQSYSAFVAQVGSDVQSAQNTQQTAQSLLNAIDSQRQSVAGVSLDEEMTNLIAFQRGYQASARMMTTIDSMLDTLINHTGTVGL